MTMAEEFQSLLVKPPASFFRQVDEEKPGKGYKAKHPPKEVIDQKTVIIKAAAAELNARRQEESFNRVLDALRKIGRPSNSADVCMESRTISKRAARTTMAKLHKKGVLVRHEAAGNDGKRWSYAYWFNEEGAP